MAKLYWHRSKAEIEPKVSVFVKVSEGVGVNAKRLQKVGVNLADYYSSEFWSCLRDAGKFRPKPAVDVATQRCGAAFALLPFVHRAAFCWVKRRSADKLDFVATTLRIQCRCLISGIRPQKISIKWGLPMT